MGHWTMAAIHKNSTEITGWHIDSLGPGYTTGDIFAKLERCFCSKNDSFEWLPTLSSPQREVECGPRALLAMFTIASDFKNPNLQPQQNIHRALHPCSSAYDPVFIRHHVMKITCDMLLATDPNSNNNPRVATRKRFKRKRRILKKLDKPSPKTG